METTLTGPEQAVNGTPEEPKRRRLEVRSVTLSADRAAGTAIGIVSRWVG